MTRLRSSFVVALLLAAACMRPAPAPHAGHEARAATTASAEPRASLHDLPTAWRDQRGDTVSLAGIPGRVRVLALVYTSCHATCPLIVADLKRVEASVSAARRGDVRFVLVSLDPERDTPGRLAEWAAQTRLDPARWTLLAGDDGAVRELAATLDVRYQRQPDGEMAHTNAITVLDRDGAVAHQQVGLGDAAGETVAAVARLLR